MMTEGLSPRLVGMKQAFRQIIPPLSLVGNLKGVSFFRAASVSVRKFDTHGFHYNCAKSGGAPYVIGFSYAGSFGSPMFAIVL